MTSATWQTDILGVQGTKAAKLGRNSGTEVCDGVTENLKLGQESFNLSYHLLVEMSLEKNLSVPGILHRHDPNQVTCAINALWEKQKDLDSVKSPHRALDLCS